MSQLTRRVGGTAACALAGRLQSLDPNISILLIEHGPNNYNDPSVVNPAVVLKNVATNSKMAHFHKCKANEYLDGREVAVLSGGVFGGGSSINLMVPDFLLNYKFVPNILYRYILEAKLSIMTASTQRDGVTRSFCRFLRDWRRFTPIRTGWT